MTELFQLLLRFFFRELWSIALKNSFNDRMFCQNFSFFVILVKKYWKYVDFSCFIRIFLDFSSINDSKKIWLYLLCFESFNIFAFVFSRIIFYGVKRTRSMIVFLPKLKINFKGVNNMEILSIFLWLQKMNKIVYVWILLYFVFSAVK